MLRCTSPSLNNWCMNCEPILQLALKRQICWLSMNLFYLLATLLMLMPNNLISEVQVISRIIRLWKDFGLKSKQKLMNSKRRQIILVLDNFFSFQLDLLAVVFCYLGPKLQCSHYILWHLTFCLLTYFGSYKYLCRIQKLKQLMKYYNQF